MSADMSLAEKIILHLQALPKPQQVEVLDFVEFLRTRSARRDDAEWSDFSIQNALRGMEQEPSPYTLSDIRKSFK